MALQLRRVKCRMFLDAAALCSKPDKQGRNRVKRAEWTPIHARSGGRLYPTTRGRSGGNQGERNELD